MHGEGVVQWQKLMFCIIVSFSSEILGEGSSTTTTKIFRDSWIFLDHTFLGLELGTLFPARESLVSDNPAGDGNIAKLFFTVYGQQYELKLLKDLRL